MTRPETPAVHTFSFFLRSRYSETDKMGYVYYGRFLEFFEVARTEMVRDLGLPYSELEDQGILLPVVHADVNYHAPVFYDEQMEIRVSLYDPPGVRLDTWYEVYTTRQESPHVTGRVTLVFLDAKTRRPRRAPAHFLERIPDRAQ